KRTKYIRRRSDAGYNHDGHHFTRLYENPAEPGGREEAGAKRKELLEFPPSREGAKRKEVPGLAEAKDRIRARYFHA
ncbi:hypothetical protein T484DRAFT_1822161, partial [Baffinella frigidus]